jgi:anti-sigma-K factor RskA
VALQAAAAEGDPQHVTVHLTSAGSPWSARVVVVPGGEAFLVPGKMPAISSSRTFQAWALVGGKFVSLGVIGPSGAEMQLQPSMTEVLINSEPQGGTSRPTTTPFLSGALPKSY